ncbi:MAG: hypothetical protein Q7T13_03410 [Polaromonas sp.]|nr:hypothetical protein [Polaromonas sp.]
MSTSSILWGVLFGSLGAGYALYGKKQRALLPFLCGLALMLFPYFVHNTYLLVVVGAALAAAPFIFR